MDGEITLFVSGLQQNGSEAALPQNCTEGCRVQLDCSWTPRAASQLLQAPQLQSNKDTMLHLPTLCIWGAPSVCGNSCLDIRTEDLHSSLNNRKMLCLCITGGNSVYRKLC